MKEVCQRTLHQYNEKFQYKVKTNSERLQLNTKELFIALDKFDYYGDLKKSSEHLTDITTLDEQLDEMKFLQDQANYQEEILGLSLTDYSQIQQKLKNAKMYLKMWDLISGWQNYNYNWMHFAFSSINKKEIDEYVNEYEATLNELLEDEHLA